MKKLFYFSAAVLALVSVSCRKQEVPHPQKDDNTSMKQTQTFTPFVISAVVDDDVTKTEYIDDGTKYVFKWSAHDEIGVQLYKYEDSALTNNVDQLPFTAQCTEASTSTTFEQNAGTFDLTPGHIEQSPYTNKGFGLGDYAFYPRHTGSNPEGLQYSGNGTNTTNDWVKLYETIPFLSTKPMSIIPMIGKKEVGSDGTPIAEYHFKPATGVLKLTVNDIPVGATKIVISAKKDVDISNGKNVLCGQWSFDEASYTDGLSMETASSGNNTKTLTFSGLDGQNKDFYIPIPAGTIEGLLIEIRSDNAMLYRVSTTSDILIARGVVKELNAITAQNPLITISGTADDPQLNYNKNGWAKVYKFCAYMSDTESNVFSSYPSTFFFSNNSGSYKLKDWGYAGKLSSSGKFYLHWLAISEDIDASSLTTLDDSRIKAYGTIPFYYLSTEDVAKFTGTYTWSTLSAFSRNATSSWIDLTGKTDSELVIEKSNDPTKGCIMITSLDGFSYTGTMTNTSIIPAGTALNPGNTPINFEGTYGAGNPQYGYFENYPTVLRFVNTSPFFSLNGTNYYLRHGAAQYSYINFDVAATISDVRLTYGSPGNGFCFADESKIKNTGTYDSSEVCLRFNGNAVAQKAL